MKNELVPLETYNNFDDAATRASSLAREYGSHTSLQRTAEGWLLLVSPFIRSVLNYPEYNSFEPIDPLTGGIDTYGPEDPNEEPRREVLEELESDQDSWARAEESGWFYDDE